MARLTARPTVTPNPARELRRARDAVFREYLARRGRVPSRALVDELVAGAWYRLSDAALAALYRAMRRRGQEC